MTADSLPLPKQATRAEWLAARKALLLKEKEATKARDALNRLHRELPVVEIDKEYTFAGPKGPLRLIELFDGRKQLIVYHFMFDPNDAPEGKSGAPFDEGCPGCSFAIDNIGNLAHLNARETTLVMVSRAPLEKIAPFQKRMGWTIPWYSSHGNDFNQDFHVTFDESVRPVEYNYLNESELEQRDQLKHIQGELPGLSVFLQHDGRVYHSYSTYARGLEWFLGLTHLLDLTPYGRGEGWDGMPNVDGLGQGWLRHHDKYGATAAACCASTATAKK